MARDCAPRERLHGNEAMGCYMLSPDHQAGKWECGVITQMMTMFSPLHFGEGVFMW